ncbi:zinc finger protein 358-like [Anopheles nili]|uniref:zinc finger protein 358-like n=1 Tax=Anopheles nili TaxID=185578 RepID=UPI00237C1545|nr:zinc finger protein 358-like [Anopheles nili]
MNNVLCRLCLIKCEELFGMYITSPSGVQQSLPQILRECLSIDVTDTEPSYFSKFICNECVYKLDLFYTFRQQSLKSQEYYNGLVLYYQPSIPCSSKIPPESAAGPVSTAYEMQIEQQTQSDQSAHTSNELADINFSGNEFMMDETEKNQLCKDYDDIIQSLQKDDLDFTANDEELGIKHELEISIPSRGEKHARQHAAAQQECPEPSYIYHTAADPRNVVCQQTEPASDECFNAYDSLSATTAKDVVSGISEPDDDMGYDDFVGIPTGTLNDGNESPVSVAQVREIIEDGFSATLQKVQPTSISPALPREIDLPTSQLDAQQPNEPYQDSPTTIPYEEIEATAATSNAVDGTEPNPQPLNDKTCELCYKTFRTRQKLSIHRNTHLRLAPFKCTFEGCAKAFKSRIGLEEHLARHTNSFEYSCDICAKGFQHRSYLSAHRRAHSTERKFQCIPCGQSFKSKQALIDHKNRHLGVKPFACELCDKQYTKNALLQAHIQQAHGEPHQAATRYPCTECGKCYTSKSYLTVHMRIHRNERSFVCEICAKGHVTRKDLAVHMTIHTGEKPLVCDICGKAYARRGALDWHRRTHTKERPYSCDVCGQTFSQSTPLQVHRRTHDVAVQKKQPAKEERLPIVMPSKPEHDR